MSAGKVRSCRMCLSKCEGSTWILVLAKVTVFEMFELLGQWPI